MKLPRDISGEDAVRVLSRMGFEVVRQHGSHIRLARGQARLTVPKHKTIAPKTLQTILRQAGISVNEFLSQL